VDLQEQLNEVLPFPRKSIDEGMKYLGFVLNPNTYLFEDWMWLLNKIKSQIYF
jgi:hypothetical protein